MHEHRRDPSRVQRLPRPGAPFVREAQPADVPIISNGGMLPNSSHSLIWTCLVAVVLKAADGGQKRLSLY